MTRTFFRSHPQLLFCMSYARGNRRERRVSILGGRGSSNRRSRTGVPSLEFSSGIDTCDSDMADRPWTQRESTSFFRTVPDLTATKAVGNLNEDLFSLWTVPFINKNVRFFWMGLRQIFFSLFKVINLVYLLLCSLRKFPCLQIVGGYWRVLFLTCNRRRLGSLKKWKKKTKFNRFGKIERADRSTFRSVLLNPQ